MRPIKPSTRRRSLWRTVLLALVAIVFGGAGTVAVLGVTKVIDLGKLAFWRSKAEPIPAGWIAVPVAAPTDPRLHDGHPGFPDESEDRRLGNGMDDRRKWSERASFST